MASIHQMGMNMGDHLSLQQSYSKPILNGFVQGQRGQRQSRASNCRAEGRLIQPLPYPAPLHPYGAMVHAMVSY